MSKEHLEGKGVLEAAVMGNQSNVLRRLLDLGFDPDERMRSWSHSSEQSVVCAWCKPGCCARLGSEPDRDGSDLLLERGADPNAKVYGLRARP